MERPAEKPAANPIPVVIAPFWMKYSSREKALVMQDFLVTQDPSREKQCCDYFKEGQLRDWIKNNFPAWFPPGHTDVSLAELLKVHRAQIYRARTRGVMTLPTLFQLLRVLGIQWGHLPDRPPDIISMLAGLAFTVPLMAAFLPGRKAPPNQATHHDKHDSLTVADCALLRRLTHSSDCFRQWLQTCARFKADLTPALSEPAFQELLSEHLDGAISMVTEDPDALQDLSQYKAHDLACDCFCRRLARLWNEYQLAWIFTLEAVIDLADIRSR